MPTFLHPSMFRGFAALRFILLERTKMVYRLPTNDGLWTTYAQLRHLASLLVC